MRPISANMQRDAIDLGSGDVSRLFRGLFFPTLLGMTGISLVTVADGMFIGHGVGSDGIAAVNIACVPVMLIAGVGLMMGAGCSVVSAIHLGRGNVKAARLNLTQALAAGSLIALLVCLAVWIFPEPVLRALGCSDTLMPLCKDYILWYSLSWMFEVWTCIALLMVRLDGSPRYAMGCSLTAAVFNVVLDYLFIIVFSWGVKGAAIATAIATIAGGSMAIIYPLFIAKTMKVTRIKLSRKSLRLSLRNVGYQCSIGLSGLLTELTIAVLMFMGNWVFMTYLQEDGVGAFGIACYYTPFFYMIGNSIAQSAQPIISYNFGQGKWKRVRDARRTSLVAALICGLACTLLFLFCPRLLVWLFIDLKTNAAAIAMEGFPWFSAAFIPFVVNLSIIGYYQSVERPRPATALALLRGVVLLVPSFLLLPLILPGKGMWLALAASELLTTLIAIVPVLLRRKAFRCIRFPH